MRNTFQKFTIAASIVCALVGSSAARAATYDVTGTNLEGQTLVGMMTGDLTTNIFTSANVADSALSSPLTIVSGNYLYTADQSAYATFMISSDPSSTLSSLQANYNANVAAINIQFQPSLCGTDPACTALVTQELTDALEQAALDNLAPFVLTATPVSTTPLPAALPLYASGLGVAAFVAWRKRRKQAAALVPSARYCSSLKGLRIA